MKTEVRFTATYVVPAFIKLSCAKYRVPEPETDEHLNKAKQFVVTLLQRPIEPTKLVIMTIAVVVAMLSPADFITHKQHGHTAGKHEQAKCILHLLHPKSVHPLVFGFTFRAAIPAIVVISAVVIVF